MASAVEFRRSRTRSWHGQRETHKMKETLPENESLSPRTREASAPSLTGLVSVTDNRYQLMEGVVDGVEESDPPILVLLG